MSKLENITKMDIAKCFQIAMNERYRDMILEEETEVFHHINNNIIIEILDTKKENSIVLHYVTMDSFEDYYDIHNAEDKRNKEDYALITLETGENNDFKLVYLHPVDKNGNLFSECNNDNEKPYRREYVISQRALDNYDKYSAIVFNEYLQDTMELKLNKCTKELEELNILLDEYEENENTAFTKEQISNYMVIVENYIEQQKKNNKNILTYQKEYIITEAMEILNANHNYYAMHTEYGKLKPYLHELQLMKKGKLPKDHFTEQSISMLSNINNLILRCKLLLSSCKFNVVAFAEKLNLTQNIIQEYSVIIDKLFINLMPVTKVNTTVKEINNLLKKIDTLLGTEWEKEAASLYNELKKDIPFYYVCPITKKEILNEMYVKKISIGLFEFNRAIEEE